MVNKHNITKEFLEDWYLVKNKSLAELSRKLSIPHETLYYYKNKWRIPTLPQGHFLKAKRVSPQTEFKKGSIPWNKGKTGLKTWNKGLKLSKQHKKKVSISTRKAMQRPEVKEKIKRTQFKKGIIPWNKDRTGVYSAETLLKIRKARLSQIFPKKDTGPEIIVFNLLRTMRIPFKKHKNVKNLCPVDAFIDQNICLFVDGDYWHCNPLFYKSPKTLAQKKNLIRDNKANSKLRKEGFVVIRVWEHDLKVNFLKFSDFLDSFLDERIY
jgi:G:T-mismatch repair DNA endonuclease (very short patch repair protein)